MMMPFCFSLAAAACKSSRDTENPSAMLRSVKCSGLQSSAIRLRTTYDMAFTSPRRLRARCTSFNIDKSRGFLFFGGTKRKRGGDRRSVEAKNQSGPRSTLKSREEAAAVLGIGEQEARALETVFTTPGVPEALKRSDRWIAEKCAVGHSFVSNMRKELSTVDSSKERRTGKDGKAKVRSADLRAAQRFRGVAEIDRWGKKWI